MSRTIKSALGTAVSLLVIWLVFKGTNWAEFLQIIRGIHYPLLIVAVVLLIFSVWIRAIRWRTLISKVGDVSTRDLYRVTMVGYLGNNILPFRMGELLRAYVISLRTNIVFSGALSSIIVERLVDLTSFILIVTVVFSLVPINDLTQKIALMGLVVCLAFLVVSFFLARYSDRFEKWYLEEQRRLNARGKQTLGNHLAGFCRGVESLWQNPRPFQTIFLSLLLWGIYFSLTVLALLAFRFNLTFLDAMKIGILILSFVTLAITVPSAPGAVGTYHAAAIAALQIVHINVDAARAFAVIFHLTQYVPLTFIGLYYFFRLNLHGEHVLAGFGQWGRAK